MRRRSVILIAMACICAGAAIGSIVPWSSIDPAGLVSGTDKRPAAAMGGPARSRVVQVGVESIGTETFADRVEAIGSIRANQAVAIVAEAAGRVSEINFRAGQSVAKGDLLVQLDNRDQAIALNEASAAFTEASAAYERQQALAKSKVATVATLEQARAVYLKTQAMVERAKRDLERQRITAPFDGVVGLSRTDVGAWVVSSEVLTTLDDLKTVEIEFQLPERLLGRIKTGQSIDAATPAFAGRAFIGTIADIDTRVDPASRAFTVRARIANEDLALKPGMFVNVTVTLEEKVAVAVPEGAVMALGRETYVFVLDDGKAQRRVIQLGLRDGSGHVEVIDGLGQGEQVISSGVQTLTDGSQVNVLKGAVADAKPRHTGPGT